MALKELEDLNRYITILIVEDHRLTRESLQLALEREGYENVWAVEKAEEALEHLSETNILLADYQLPTSTQPQDGIALVRKAKEDHGDRIEAIVFSGKGDGDTRQAAIDAQAAAFLEKPVRTDHIKLWIKELGKRIWLQQILDTDPDEVLIMDRWTGTILFAGKEKKRIFGDDLIGDKCFLRFEERPPCNGICKGCPGAKAYDENRTVRTEWDYKTMADIQKHKVHQEQQTIDLVNAPLRDILGKPRAIIDISRDITMQKVAERIIGEMEKAADWEQCRKLFMDGFEKLGYPRARLHLRDRRDGKDQLTLVDQRGKYDGELGISHSLEEDIPSKLLIKSKAPHIVIVDFENVDKDYRPDPTISNRYGVGNNKAFDNTILKKTEWIDIPLIAGGEVIGKVSLDGWDPHKDAPDSYDLEVLGRYGASAGQIIQNAQNGRDIEQRAKMEQTILEISKDITDIAKSDVLLNDAVRLACETMRVRMCSIFLLEDETGKLVRKQSYATSKRGQELTEAAFYAEVYARGASLTRSAFDKGVPYYTNDLRDMVRKERQGITNGVIHLPSVYHYEGKLEEPLCNSLYVPLMVGEHRIGLLRATNKYLTSDFGDRDFDQNDKEMFELLAGQIAVALHNANLQKDKERYLEDLVHTMKTNLQALFNVAGKFTGRKILTWKEVREHGEDLEHSLVESKDQLEGFRFMIKAEDPKDYKFAEHLLLPLVEEVVRGERSKREVELHLGEIAYIKIWADKRMFQRALHILVHNADQYSIPKDKPVLIRGCLLDDSVRIDVINYSVEIPEDEREKIFERYYRSDWAKRMSSGAGIGLHTVKEIVGVHNGRIEVSSVPVEENLYENTFSIFLPLKRGA